MATFSLQGNLVDIPARKIFPALIDIVDGRIERIAERSDPVDGFIVPGFVDAHVHVESSMLLPSEFARLAVTHGSVATVSDPHEIANVLGVPGVDFMIANGNKVPFHFFFGAPSCVPATEMGSGGWGDANQVMRRVRLYQHMANTLEELDKDREFLKKGGVFTDDFIDSFIALKTEESDRFRMMPHPIEFDMYYSC